jgi:hypothetical protein
MNVKANVGRHAPKGKRSLFDHCEQLDMRADSMSEAAWMSELARLLVTSAGGTLKIRANGRPEVVVEFGEATPPEGAIP